MGHDRGVLFPEYDNHFIKKQSRELEKNKKILHMFGRLRYRRHTAAFGKRNREK